MQRQNHGKKPYQKPTLANVTVFEASGKTCCKTSLATCSAAARTMNGKGARASTTS